MMAVKRVIDLTLDELKSELGKRGLDKDGDKSVLLARLRKALTDEKQRLLEKNTSTVKSTTSERTNISDLPTNALGVLPCDDSDGVGGGGGAGIKEHVAALGGPKAAEQHSFKSGQKDDKQEACSTSGNPEKGDDPVFSSKAEQLEMTGREPTETEKEVKNNKNTKAVDDPPLVVMVDESQNDFDDDIELLGGALAPPPLEEKPRFDGEPSTSSGGNLGEKKTLAATTTAVSSIGKKHEKDVAKPDFNVWISGLSSSSKAADLKTLFDKCGKVTGAKVVASAKSPGAKYYGIVTMASADDVTKCIKDLNGTTLHGKVITVELYSKRRIVVEKAISSTPPTPTLWITGIGQNTRAADLKKIFLAYGKVNAATIVMSASRPGSKRFGLVKMSSCEEADLCIEKLNMTKQNGEVITVERAKSNSLQGDSNKTPAKAREAPPLMSQTVNAPMGKGKTLKGKIPVLNRKQRKATKRLDIKKKMVMRRSSNLPIRPTNLMSIQHQQPRWFQHEEELKSKQKDLLEAISLEYDRRRQEEDAQRLAFEREQLELEKLQLERERIESERLRFQLEEERRRNEREEMEQERMKIQLLRHVNELTAMNRDKERMSLKRMSSDTEGSSSTWDYMVKKSNLTGDKKEKDSPFSGHSHSTFHHQNDEIYERTNSRLQQLASTGEERRFKQPSSNFLETTNPKSEWKSLHETSARNYTGNDDNDDDSHWKSLLLSSSLRGNSSLSGSHFPSSSSSSSLSSLWRDKPQSGGGSSAGTSGSSFGMRSQSQYGGFTMNNSARGNRGGGGSRGGGRWN